MSAHTPGPWEIDDRDPDAIEIVGRPKWKCTRLGERGKWDVCTVDDLMGDYPKEVEANARLIAAAPDLLEALVVARGWHQGDKWRASDAPEQAAKWQEQMDRINSAIAKATGTA